MKALFSLLLVAPSIALAGIFDDLPDLQGKTVIYAGDFEQITCPIGGKYDCTNWPIELLKTKSGREICLKPSSLITCSYSCRGIIAVGSDKTPYLYVFERMGSDAKKSGFEVYKCPSLY